MLIGGLITAVVIAAIVVAVAVGGEQIDWQLRAWQDDGEWL